MATPTLQGSAFRDSVSGMGSRRRFSPFMRSSWRILTVFAVAWWALALIERDAWMSVIFALPLLLLFIAFVWPTEWRYHHHNGYLLRQHRMDGTIETFTKDGWVMIEAPTEEAVTGHIPTAHHG